MKRWRCSEERVNDKIVDPPFYLLIHLHLRKMVLPHAAQGAHKILGQVLPGGSGGDAVVGVSGGFVIGVAADIADVFLHAKDTPFYDIFERNTSTLAFVFGIILSCFGKSFKHPLIDTTQSHRPKRRSACTTIQIE